MKTRKNIHRLALYALTGIFTLSSSFAGRVDDMERQVEEANKKWPKTLRVYASTYAGIPAGTVFQRDGWASVYSNAGITNFIRDVNLSVLETNRWYKAEFAIEFGDDGSRSGSLSEKSEKYQDLIEFVGENPTGYCVFNIERLGIYNGYLMLLVERWMTKGVFEEWSVCGEDGKRIYGGDGYDVSECLGSFILVDGAMDVPFSYSIRGNGRNLQRPSMSTLTDAGVVIDSRNIDPRGREHLRFDDLLSPYDPGGFCSVASR